MGLNKKYSGYTSFQYLRPGIDYKPFELAPELNRTPGHLIPLTLSQEERVNEIVRENIMISLHEHLGVFPLRIKETPAYLREGRMVTGFKGLAHSPWDAVFDNLMNGLCHIESKNGWKWTEVLHDLGMRLCDIAHQDFVILCKKVSDIRVAHRQGKLAWIPSIEGAAMIENEIDRIDLLYGFGVRALGITYSESNALGSGLKEPRDGGLTRLGRKAVERMNRLGMLIDCSHTSDQTALDAIACSSKPIVLSHIGARKLWNTRRLAPDDVLKACADKGGIIGVEAAPHATLTTTHRVHTIDAVMAHFEYIKNLVGIDHVSFGPDTVYGDHVGLHRLYTNHPSLKASKTNASPGMEYEEVSYVKGMENPTECASNIVRWLVKHNYTNEDIAKVIGGNTLRLLNDVWI